MPVVERLQGYHDRKGFDCGKDSLNQFLQKQARQNADRNVGVTHVVVAAPGDSKILGYYTLVTRTLESSVVPVKKLPAGPIGVVLLGRLAVDKGSQGQGIGKMMLLRAMAHTEEAARNIGIFALVLDTLDEDAQRWYTSLGWGFEALLDDPNHLFLPIGTIRELGLTEG
jgi:GNAT superfamily N-acetyltransferase